MKKLVLILPLILAGCAEADLQRMFGIAAIAAKTTAGAATVAADACQDLDRTKCARIATRISAGASGALDKLPEAREKVGVLGSMLNDAL